MTGSCGYEREGEEEMGSSIIYSRANSSGFVNKMVEWRSVEFRALPLFTCSIKLFPNPLHNSLISII